MPYFWESPKWEKRLQQLEIWHQHPSGYALKEDSLNMANMASVGFTQLESLTASCDPEDPDSNIYGPLQFLTTSVKNICTEFVNLSDPASQELGGFFQPNFLLNKLFELFRVLPGESILEYLLYKPGICRVVKNEELTELQNYMENFLKKVSELLEEHDGRFQFIPDQIGSMAEQCRPGYGDEYDYRLDLQFDTSRINEMFEDGNYDIGKVYKEVNEGSLNFLLDFYPAFQATMMSLLAEESNGPLKFAGFDFNDTGIIFMCFEWRRGDSKREMLIKVDCVPSIPLHDFWPSNQLLDPRGDPIKPLSHIALKLNTKNHLLHPVWSVCGAEVAFMASLSDQIKDAYTLTKTIWGASILGADDSSITYTVKLQSAIPSSYELKNSLYTCLMERKISGNLDSGVDRTLQVVSIAHHILQNVIFHESKNFFLSGRCLRHNSYFDYSGIALTLLENLKEQHISKHVPKQYDTQEIDGPKELAKLPWRIFSDIHKWRGECYRIGNMEEHELEAQEDKMVDKMQESYIDWNRRAMDFAFQHFERGQRSNPPIQDGNESDISLD